MLNESEPTAADRSALLQVVESYQISRAAHIAAVLGIADLLVDGAKGIEELAAATQTHAPSLYRLLRALASVGVFAENADGRFSLTQRAHYFRSDVPGSLRAWTMMLGSPSFWSSWGGLLGSVRSGEYAFLTVHGQTNWEYRAQRREENAVFDAAMTERSAAASAAIVAGYDFAQFTSIVDIGGGQGVLLGAILAANPRLRGIVFDQSHVVEDAPRVLEQLDIDGRCDIVEGDFFKSVPTGADAYLMKSVLHDWDDEQAVAILKTCRAAMAESARLLVIEVVVRGPNAPDPAKFMDLLMMVMNGGRERTEPEFDQLLSASGFRLMKVWPTRSLFSIVEAQPV